ncbi:hypothetical protein ACIRFH_23755 [Streptomyces sp. NPDC093586]|uniref:hypothetical protein n=1 Tax=Streptomyces sp. NPDC093586 TaxID=3366042 RepID=UPI00381C8B50
MSALSDLAASFPPPERLRQWLRGLTVVETCLDSTWPRYTYTPADESGFEHFAFENGGGDDYHVFFGPSLTFFRAFDHESPLSPYADDALWPGLLDGLPEPLEPLTRLPADESSYPAITLALWHDGGSWRHGAPQPRDGEEAELTDWVLGPLRRNVSPDSVADHLEDFYGRRVDSTAVGAVLRKEPVTPELIGRVAPDADVDRVMETVRALDGQSVRRTVGRTVS